MIVAYNSVRKQTTSNKNPNHQDIFWNLVQLLSSKNVLGPEKALSQNKSKFYWRMKFAKDKYYALYGGSSFISTDNSSWKKWLAVSKFTTYQI